LSLGSTLHFVKRSREKHYVKLRDLIDQGQLRPPAELVKDYKGQRLTATVLADGSVRWNGKTFDSISGAASAAKTSRDAGKGNPRTNGWRFWYVTTPEGTVPLGDLRDRVRKPASGG
jgi:hypothetical protein